MTSWTRELDEAAVLATRAGCWHVLLFWLLCGLAAIPTSFLVFSQVFTNATPAHWCAPPPELAPLALPPALLRNLTAPPAPPAGVGAGGFHSCLAYHIDVRALYAALNDYVEETSELVRQGGALRMVTTRRLAAAAPAQRDEQIAKVQEAILNIRGRPEPCAHGWAFDTDHYSRTLVTEYSLVCDKEWLPRAANTLFWVGSIFGNLFFGLMSDRYGRRPTILLMILLEVPLAAAAAFPGSYGGYVALRVAGGLFFPALYQLPFILALELMPPGRRTYTGIVVGMLFAAGMCLLALLAFALRDWRHLSLATTLPFILLYGHYWLIPESPRWLVGRGRLADAENVFRDLAKKNGIHLPRGFLLELHKQMKNEEDREAEIRMLNVNGYSSNVTDTDKDEYIDKKNSNMLTFKPDLSNINEEESKDGLEKQIALEVAEIINNQPKSKKDKIDANEESHSNSDSQQKSTQTEPLKSPPRTLRRKSYQMVAQMFTKDENEAMVNKIMDDQNSEGDCKASPLDMLRYPNIRKKVLLLTFTWTALGVVYNSLSYNTPNLGVDDYLAFFIGGAVELPAYALAWRVMERHGRRPVLAALLAAGGLACLATAPVPHAWPWVTVALAMVGRLCAAAAFAVFYVFCGELLPTVLRAQAMAAASLAAGLGLLACPYIVHLAVHARFLPLLVTGALCVLGAGGALLLPETLGRPLPQTLADGDARPPHYPGCCKNTRERDCSLE